MALALAKPKRSLNRQVLVGLLALLPMAAFAGEGLALHELNLLKFARLPLWGQVIGYIACIGVPAAAVVGWLFSSDRRERGIRLEAALCQSRKVLREARSHHEALRNAGRRPHGPATGAGEPISAWGRGVKEDARTR
jgi:hypothetical protein